MFIVRCPTTWDEGNVFPFLAQLSRVQDELSLCLDFTKVGFVRPFGAILTGNAIQQLVKHRKDHKLETFVQIDQSDRADSSISYLKHIGFFSYVGLPLGKKLGDASGGSRYAPITVIQRNELKGSAKGTPIQQAIEVRSDQLASVVFPQMTEQIMVSYCLREVIRNVFEHAETDKCIVMAQRYSTGQAEIAILDNGIGIYHSLSRSHDFESVEQALRAAIQPGISGATTREQSGKWSNSGFGLYVLSELGAANGEFLIASNDNYLQISASSSALKGGSVIFQGTAIKLVVDLAKADYFPNLLHQIVDRGENAESAKTGELIKASTSSKSISEGLL